MVEKMYINLPGHQPYHPALATKGLRDPEIPHVAILQIPACINATNCDELIAQAHALRASGQDTLLLDLRAVSELGTMGLVVLRAIAALYAGEAGAEDGMAQRRGTWYKRIWRPAWRQSPRIKLFGTKPHIRSRLERAAFPVYDSLVTALMAV